ncbi:MAG: cell wall-active antibiotics response protein [Bacteroidetes bacterium]|nr:cell wall-active antibiotics response protein [Bacteroidota bacterium]MBU1720083.1 cell wall-active antibiotics response protein [Bacteroidota bacterium]
MKTHHKHFRSHFEDQRNRRSHKTRVAVIGFSVILAGVLLMLGKLEIIDPYWMHVIFSWKMLLVAIGAISLFGHGRIHGVILMGVGGFFLIPEVFQTDMNFSQLFWPVIIIAAGMMILTSMLWAKRFHRHSISRSESNMDQIDDSMVFGGADRIITSENFKGGRISAVFGGCKVDLTKAKLAEGNNILEISAVFGGLSLLVPADWNIKVEVTSVLGGFEDKKMFSNGNIDTSRSLIIKGSTVFGGGEIKRY